MHVHSCRVLNLSHACAYSADIVRLKCPLVLFKCKYPFLSFLYSCNQILSMEIQTSLWSPFSFPLLLLLFRKKREPYDLFLTKWYVVSLSSFFLLFFFPWDFLLSLPALFSLSQTCSRPHILPVEKLNNLTREEKSSLRESLTGSAGKFHSKGTHSSVFSAVGSIIFVHIE